jgi:hypothetical protein
MVVSGDPCNLLPEVPDMHAKLLPDTHVTKTLSPTSLSISPQFVVGSALLVRALQPRPMITPTPNRWIDREAIDDIGASMIVRHWLMATAELRVPL